MDYFQVINRAIDFIEGHLAADISPHVVSREAFCSTPHLYRVFRYMLGVSIKEYIRKRRLSQAAESLMHGKSKVIDLAMALRYESPVCFSRAFRREYGISPQYFRDQVQEVALFERLDPATVAARSGPAVRVISRRAEIIRGPWLRTSMAGGKNQRDIPAFWAGLSNSGVLSRFAGDCFYGIYTDWFGEDAFTLLAGTAASDDAGERPYPDWKATPIPAHRYGVFPVAAGNPRALVETWTYIYGTWFPQTGRERPRGLVDFERYAPDGTAEICIPLLD